MKYAAIPTLYEGVQFRSRLEARWAAFFNLAGVLWEYEPVDLDGYIPDFVIFKGRYLVEVKPADAPRACAEACRKIDRSGWTRDAMVVGLSPEVSVVRMSSDHDLMVGQTLHLEGVNYWTATALFTGEKLFPGWKGLWVEAGNLTQYKGRKAKP